MACWATSGCANGFGDVINVIGAGMKGDGAGMIDGGANFIGGQTQCGGMAGVGQSGSAAAMTCQ